MMARAVRLLVAPIIAIAAAIQVTSYALFGGAAAQPSVPAFFTAAWPFDLAGTKLGRVPALRRELARAALLRGDAARAATLLDGAGAGDDAEDLRGRLAAATNNAPGAMQHFGRAGDIVRARALVDGVAARDPAAALGLAETFDRATTGRDIPAAVIAQSDWREGELAAAVAAQRPGSAAGLMRESLAKYEAAAQLDPTQDAYGLSLGFEALVAGDAARSRDAYARVLANDPQSLDAAVGLAVANAVTGACSAASAAYARAQALAPQQHRILDLTASGYPLPTQKALSRCLGRPPSS